jgi:hypothetical protein
MSLTPCDDFVHRAGFWQNQTLGSVLAIGEVRSAICSERSTSACDVSAGLTEVEQRPMHEDAVV